MCIEIFYLISLFFSELENYDGGIPFVQIDRLRSLDLYSVSYDFRHYALCKRNPCRNIQYSRPPQINLSHCKHLMSGAPPQLSDPR